MAGGRDEPTWQLDRAEAELCVNDSSWSGICSTKAVVVEIALDVVWMPRIMVTISTAATMARIAIQDWPVFSCGTGSHAVISGSLVTLPALTVRAFSAAGECDGCPVGSWEGD